MNGWVGCVRVDMTDVYLNQQYKVDQLSEITLNSLTQHLLWEIA